MRLCLSIFSSRRLTCEGKGQTLSPPYHMETLKIDISLELPKSLSYVFDYFKRLLSAMSKTFNWDGLKTILKEFIFIDIIGSLKEFKDSLIQAKDFIKSEYQELTELGFNAYFKKVFIKIKAIPNILKEKIKSLINYLDSLSKKEWIILITKILVFCVATYLGYNIPDLDITLFGIGAHRSFLTHSILPILGVGIIGKFLKRVSLNVEKNCDDKDEDIKSMLNGSRSLVDTIVSGIAFGVSVHLSQDLFFDGSQTIRGPWDRDQIPPILRKNYRFDDGYLLVNQIYGYKKAYKY